MSFANNSQNISFKNIVLILCLDFVATSLWDGNLLPWLQVSRSSRRKSMLSQWDSVSVQWLRSSLPCFRFRELYSLLVVFMCIVPWTEAQCLLPERYLVVRQMWLDDGGYCDWVRQYGDSSKFWWEWWGADCYSITWWKRCWMKGFLRLHMILVEGGQGSHFDKDEKMTLNELWIAQTYTGSILVAVNPYQVFLHHYWLFCGNCCVFIKLLKGNIFKPF